MLRLRRTMPPLIAIAALAGCGPPGIDAPADKGVCWTMNTDKAGKATFHKIAHNVQNLEHCAANLEALRLKFIGLGGNRTELDGVYQGVFIYLRREGIFSSTDSNKQPYLALVRTNDGRLVVPGAQSQSAP